MLTIFEGENSVAFDIDQTIFMHDSTCSFNIINPYTKDKVYGYENTKHCNLLREYKGRGLKVIIWSSAGVEWAFEVIKAFELQDYVDLILTKPNKIVDDLPPNEIFPCRIYLHE